MTRIAGNPTRARILKSASRLFYREGIRAVSMDDVARAARVTKMTVYHHFSSKNALLLETLANRRKE